MSGPLVSRVLPSSVTAVLLVGETEWREISRMTEVLVRISKREGRAGFAGFRIEYPDGTAAAVAAPTVAGVKVDPTAAKAGE